MTANLNHNMFIKIIDIVVCVAPRTAALSCCCSDHIPAPYIEPSLAFHLSYLSGRQLCPTATRGWAERHAASWQPERETKASVRPEARLCVYVCVCVCVCV